MQARSFYVVPAVLLAFVAALLWLTSTEQVRASPNEIASGPRQDDFSIQAGVPLTTPTAVPTPDREYLILQYVINSYSQWTCLGPFGTPGNRYITDCNPLPPYFTHPTSGYVVRYNTPAEAQAAWQYRRDNICPTYPICFTSGQYAYEAGNEDYPLAHYENYSAVSIWLFGAVSSDDTHFRGAPYISGAIYSAANALGYLGTATPSTSTPTPTALPPTSTRTPIAQSSPTWDLRPDLTGNLAWITSCPAPVLRLTTRLTGDASSYAPASTMRLIDNAGDTLEFPVPSLNGINSVYDYDCPAGSCLPSNWVPQLPLTLTVDYHNTVIERSETNNDFVLIFPPPVPTPCGPTPTATVTSTATPIQGCEIEFTDVPVAHTFYESVRCLACLEIVGGYPCGGLGEPCDPDNNPYYRPGALVSRGQLSKIVALAAGWQGTPGTEPFADVPLGSTFHPYIVQLYDLGYISGYPCGGPGEPCDGQSRPYFRPNGSATRGQLCKIVAQAADIDDPIPPDRQTFEDAPPGSTFWLWIERLAGHEGGLIQGYPCGNPEPCIPPGDRPYFRPNNATTRGQIAKIVSNTFFPGCRTRY